MKKIIAIVAIIAAIAIVLIAVAVGIWILRGPLLDDTDQTTGNMGTEGMTPGTIYDQDPYLNVSSKEELEELNQTHGNEVFQDDEFFMVAGVPFLDGQAQYVYTFAPSGDVTSCVTRMPILGTGEEDGEFVAVDFSVEELKQACLQKLELFCQQFGEKLDGRFYIIGYDWTILDPAEDDSYEKLCAGEAFVDFSLRDADGTFWLVDISVIGEIAIMTVEKCCDQEAYANAVANITVNSEGA